MRYIKKYNDFFLFENYSLIKTEYQLNHLNNKEKIEYFIGREIADSIPDLHDPNLPNFVPNKGIIGGYKEIMNDDLINKINEEYDKCLYS